MIRSLLLLLSISWGFFVFGVESFDNRVLYLLDEGERTYLFRGNIPQQNEEFCDEELRGEIQQYLSNCGKQISPDFKLICISFLNTFADKKDCAVESNWFFCHPDGGFLWRYPLFGYALSPFYFPKPLRKLFYLTDIDGIRRFLQQLKRLVDGDYGEDVAIYMHCRAGKDRTGEASACYLMQYKGVSYADAMFLNQCIARRKLKGMSINAIHWHAYYLRDVCHLPTVGLIN